MFSFDILLCLGTLISLEDIVLSGDEMRVKTFERSSTIAFQVRLEYLKIFNKVVALKKKN